MIEHGTVKAPHALAKRIWLIDIVNKAASKRNGMHSGDLAFTIVANRILGPRSRYNIPVWHRRICMPERIGIDLPPDSARRALA